MLVLTHLMFRPGDPWVVHYDPVDQELPVLTHAIDAGVQNGMLDRVLQDRIETCSMSNDHRLIIR